MIQAVNYSLPQGTLAGLYSGEATLDANTSFTLALHGWLDNAASFTTLMPYLTEQPCLALDFPGHGKSSHRAMDAHYYFIEWAADIVALIEQQSWQRVHLLGHSMGGLVAQLVAALIPEKITGLSLIEAFGMLSYEPQDTLDKLKQALNQRQKLKQKQPPTYTSLEKMIRLRAEASQLSPELVAPIVQRNAKKTAQGWVWRVDPRVRLSSPFRFTKPQIDTLMAGIQSPIQLILASSGWPELKQARADWGDLFPDKSVCWLAGGHHIHLEQPQETAKAVNVFLNKLEK